MDYSGATIWISSSKTSRIAERTVTIDFCGLYLRYFRDPPASRCWTPRIADVWLLLPIGTAIAIALKRASITNPQRGSTLCSVCAYDLRATPQRCPECGTPRQKVIANA